MDTKSSVTIKSVTISGVGVGIIALVSGVLVLTDWGPARWIIGIFLVIWGVVALMNRTKETPDNQSPQDPPEPPTTKRKAAAK